LNALHADPASREGASIASHKGALLFDALRKQMGDDKFFDFMKQWYSSNTTKKVTTDAFIADANHAAGKSLSGFFKSWLETAGLPGSSQDGPIFLVSDIMSRLGSTIIVYGSTTDAGANRFAAETLQRRWNERYESLVPIRKDFEVTEAETGVAQRRLRRTSGNELRAARLAISVAPEWEQGVFTAGGKEYASEYDALALAARNPQNEKRMVLVVAGNSALETVRLSSASLAMLNIRCSKPVSQLRKVSRHSDRIRATGRAVLVALLLLRVLLSLFTAVFFRRLLPSSFPFISFSWPRLKKRFVFLADLRTHTAL